jgi:hypothetical protein
MKIMAPSGFQSQRRSLTEIREEAGKENYWPIEAGQYP